MEAIQFTSKGDAIVKEGDYIIKSVKGDFYSCKLIAIVAESTNLSETDVGSVISATFDTIMDTLAKRENATIVGFGTFSVKHR